MNAPESPKLRAASEFGRSKWYPYYAGYSPDFVRSVIDILALDLNALVLDPWNGSGTTTTVCSFSGIQTIGFDLNPAMVVVAKARLISEDIAGSILGLQRSIIRQARRLSADWEDDPLGNLLDQASVRVIRSVQRAILKMLSDEKAPDAGVVPVANLSSLACFYLVALFRVVRKLLFAARTKNPTWVRASLRENGPVKIEWADLEERLLKESNEMVLSLGQRPARTGAADVKIGDSRRLPILGGSVDAVITSPPYCTRIDYAVTTRIELAVLGMGAVNGFTSLRRALLGTTLSAKNEPNMDQLGEGASSLLSSIKGHRSKASGGYYYKTFRDYFLGMNESLREIARVSKTGAPIVMVVQDSHYKDLHIDLPAVIADEAREFGLHQEARWDYSDSISMRRINRTAMSSNVTPIESAIILRKV